MAAAKGWSPELEGLRGFASLWVLLGHISLLVHWKIPVVGSPKMGVDLFILLSGFLMAKNAIARQEAEPWSRFATFKTFWLRRFFRIAPLYYVLLFVALAAGPWFGEMRDLIAHAFPATATATSRYSDQSLANILTHVSFVFGMLPHYGFNTVLPDWSIGLEMQYYLLFPVIMLAALRFGYVNTLLTIMAFCALGRYLLPDYYEAFPMPSLIFIKLHVFIAGMFLAEAVRQRRVGYVMLALLAPVMSAAINIRMDKLQIAFEVVMIIGMALVLWRYQADGFMEKFMQPPRLLLSNRVSTWLGDVSYSVYLLHLLIVIPTVAIMLRDYQLLLAGPLRFLCVAVISLPLVYLLATLLYRLVEKPGIQLGKRALAPTLPARKMA
ncbi:acyltransferase [Pantoea sp.]|uniref:acyltransferase family protein n=1 Tax=Pantoea sp. TaxID=69393 RepID=UPI0028A008F2|nr:acyltransferase [Pantoea sp.]